MVSSASLKPWWASPKNRRIVLTTFVGLLGNVGAVGAGSLILEWSITGAQDRRAFVAAGSVLIVSLVFLLVAAFLLLRLKALRGTLFHLRLLDDRQDDYHSKTLAKIKDEFLDYRVASRWVNFNDADDISAGGLKQIDLRRAVDAISTEQERAFNDDSFDSGTCIAPNMPWPAALAVGYEWFVTGRTLMFDGSSSEFDGPDSSKSIEWTFEGDDDILPKTITQSETPADLRGWALLTNFVEENPRRIFLSLQATDNPKQGYGQIPRSSLKVPNTIVGGYFAKGRLSGVKLRGNDSKVNGKSDVDGADGRNSLQVADGTEIAAFCASAIRHVLDTWHPDELVLSMRVPKTVAFLTGRLLSSAPKPGGFAAPSRNFWAKTYCAWAPNGYVDGFFIVRDSQPRISTLDAGGEP